jgi:hypothetical protein
MTHPADSANRTVPQAAKNLAGSMMAEIIVRNPRMSNYIGTPPVEAFAHCNSRRSGE